jgi:hypothetical protein
VQGWCFLPTLVTKKTLPTVGFFQPEHKNQPEHRIFLR